MNMQTNQKQVRTRFDVWWIKPSALIVAVFLLCLVAFNHSEASYISEYASRKWINFEYVAICGICVFALVVGCHFGKTARNVKSKYSQSSLRRDRLITAFYFITGICIAAYLIWYINFARLNGISSFLSVFSTSSLSDNMYVYRNQSGTISGITTFTEAGVVSAILGAVILQWDYGNKSYKTKVKMLLVLILVLAAIRSSLFSERLAIIELVVPFFVAWFCTSKKSAGVVYKLMPVLTIAGLFIIFAFFEYARSWSTHYYLLYNSYFDFISVRLFGYYTNAFNTESMFIQFGDTSWLPYWTIQWLWQIPGMLDIYSSIANPNISSEYSLLLNTYANPEYNNPGGLLTFFKDFSWFGLVLYVAFGYFAGCIYSRARFGDPLSLMLYPVIYLTILELPRYFYLGVNRGFITILAILLVMLICGRERTTLAESRVQKRRFSRMPYDSA